MILKFRWNNNFPNRRSEPNNNIEKMKNENGTILANDQLTSI